LKVVDDENGNQLEKKDAIFLAFIADYGRNAIKDKNVNIKMPQQKQKKISRAEKNRLERIEQ